MKQKLVQKSLEALFLITHINKTNTDTCAYLEVWSGDNVLLLLLLLLHAAIVNNIQVYDIVWFRRPHSHEGDFVGSKVDFYVSKLKKGCRDEPADTHTLNLWPKLEALRNADRDDRVKDITRQTPTFQSCKSVLYRSRSGKTMPTTPEESTSRIQIGGKS